MQLGLHLNDHDWAGAAGPGPLIGESARAAVEAGFDRLGVAD